MTDWAALSTVAVAVISTIGTILLAKINATAKRTEVATEQTHRAVNSERLAMHAKIDALRDEVLRLTAELAHRDGVKEGQGEQ